MDSHRFQAVIFDLDGTLLDTLHDLGDSMNRLLQRHGWPVHPPSSYKMFVGNGARKLIERAVPADQHTPEVLDQCYREFIEDYRQNWAKKTAPYTGIPELIDSLYNRGIRMSVLSNKIHDFTVRCVERFLAPEKFQLIFGERPGIPRKPDPAGALEIAEKTGIAPENTVYVGDTAIDMQTGTAAGMYTVGVLWGFRSRQELEENGAMHIIERPEELMDVIFNQNAPCPINN